MRAFDLVGTGGGFESNNESSRSQSLGDFILNASVLYTLTCAGRGFALSFARLAIKLEQRNA